MKVEPITMACKPLRHVRKFGKNLLHRQEPFLALRAMPGYEKKLFWNEQAVAIEGGFN